MSLNNQQLYFSTLERAAQRLGADGLRTRLKVPAAALSAWLSRERPIPQEVFLSAVDVLQEHDRR